MKILKTNEDREERKLARKLLRQEDEKFRETVVEWSDIVNKEAKRCPCCGAKVRKENKTFEWEVIEGDEEGLRQQKWKDFNLKQDDLVNRYYVKCYCGKCGTYWETVDFVSNLRPYKILDYDRLRCDYFLGRDLSTKFSSKHYLFYAKIE